MIDYSQFFSWSDFHIEHFYIFYLLNLIIAGFLVFNSASKYKLEIIFLSYYLLTGHSNVILTFEIPGVNLFDIQPIRFIYLLLAFFLFRKALFEKGRVSLFNNGVPWFLVALFAYVSLLIISLLVNNADIELGEMLKTILDSVAFLILLFSLQQMADRPSYEVIGMSMLIGAVSSSIVSIIQFTIDPYFLRIMEDRIAFGEVLRSNGLFSSEYHNSYYLIIAIAWTFFLVKNRSLQFVLICLYSIGIIFSFMRMSWIILFLVLIIYLVQIRKLAPGKILLLALSGITILVCISIFYYRDIMNSNLVKERLSDPAKGRQAYYAMVMENIDQKPIFGYGSLQNEVYYSNILRITRNRDRAAAVTGDLHSGYFMSLFLYGIPTFICFVLFVVLSVFYYSRRYNRNSYYVIPFLVSIIYMVANLTNNFLFLKYLSILFAIHIGIGLGIERLESKSPGLQD